MFSFIDIFLGELLNNTTVQSLVIGVVVLTLFNVAFKIWKELQKIGFSPGLRTIVGPQSVLCELMGDKHIPYIFFGSERAWTARSKHEPFKTRNRDIISMLQIYPKIYSYFYVSDPYAIKEITSNRARFSKFTQPYKILEYLGPNILSIEGEQWKRLRKLTAPAFSEKNNRLVWDETIRITQDMFNHWGRDKEEIQIDDCLDLALPITLVVISGAGFGRRISWSDDLDFPPGHTMSFKNALHLLSTHMLYIFVLPRPFFSLTKKLRTAYRAKDEVLTYMEEMIEQGREGFSEERYDLFSALLKANDIIKEEEKLSERELLSNIFIFLLAGHETTAHTLCFALGLLAIEQEEQEKLYRHIISTLGHDRDILHYEESNSLTYVMAVINETLRLFPPAVIIPKETTEDAIIPMISPEGKIESLAVPKKTCLFISIVALHYNPRYWEEPETFNPSRFLGEYHRDAFIPFSAGARACIGRGFGETEMVAALSMIIKDYKVELKSPELYAGMNKFQQRNKLLANASLVTLTPLSVPLVFRKRKT